MLHITLLFRPARRHLQDVTVDAFTALPFDLRPYPPKQKMATSNSTSLYVRFGLCFPLEPLKAFVAKKSCFGFLEPPLYTARSIKSCDRVRGHDHWMVYCNTNPQLHNKDWSHNEETVRTSQGPLKSLCANCLVALTRTQTSSGDNSSGALL